MTFKKTAKNEPATKRPDYIAYTVTEREGKDNFWTAIGAAWENKDGEGLSIRLIRKCNLGCKPRAQLGNRGWLADQALGATTVAQQDGARTDRAGCARIAENQVAQPQCASLVEMRNLPRDTHRHDTAILVCSELRRQWRDLQRPVVVRQWQPNVIQFGSRFHSAPGCVYPIAQIPVLDTIARVQNKKPLQAIAYQCTCGR